MKFNVRGKPVTDEHIRRMTERMRRAPFTAADIAAAANGHPEHYRVADRFIQMQRKAGVIRYGLGKWTWCGD